MKARYYDGLTSRPQPVEVELTQARLRFAVEDGEQDWPLDGLEIEPLDGSVRLAPRGGDARLLLEAADWRELSGLQGHAAQTRLRSREINLVVGLALGGAAITALLFFGVPAASGPLARITPPNFEAQMGRNFESQLSVAFKPCAGAKGQAALAALGRRLGQAADTPFDIRVRAVQAPIANAFALPGGAVMVTDDLIAMTRTPDELAAVIAHETAHVEKRHVMQAVWRSLGLGLLLDAVVGGGTGAGQQAVLLAGSFTDLRYGREAESEADARGMALLQANGLSSQGMAPFFERLASKGDSDQAMAVKELISSHPDSLRRARASRAMAQPGAAAFSEGEWAAVQGACANRQPGPLRRLLRAGGR